MVGTEGALGTAPYEGDSNNNDSEPDLDLDPLGPAVEIFISEADEDDEYYQDEDDGEFFDP